MSPLKRGWASLKAGVVALRIVLDIGRSAVGGVMGPRDAAVVGCVARAAASVEGVMEARDIRVRRDRRGWRVQLHVGVDDGMPSTQTDATGHLVRERILRALNDVTRVDVHVHRVNWDHPPGGEVTDRRSGARGPLGTR